jgi:superfamily II DNA or RNA helicase
MNTVTTTNNGYLSKRGYVIKKEQFTNEELLQLKTELRARPLVDTKFAAPGVNSIDSTFAVYIETKNKIYIPKMYGISKFGLPEKELENYIGKDWTSDIPFTGTLYPMQIEPVNKLIESCKTKGGGILSLGTGFGKCHSINTPILMYDGTIKMVQNIKVGDLLMGDDSISRKVLSLARGEDEMYDIIPVKGDKYTVNQEHILVLKNTKREPWIEIRIQNKIKKYDVKWWENYKQNSKGHDTKELAEIFLEKIKDKHQDIIEISVKDYLKQNKTFKHHFKGFHVGINFPKNELPIDPYMIGFWLGDGTSSTSEITTQDSTIVQYLKENLQQYKCYLQYKEQYTYRINGDGSGNYDCNHFLNTLHKFNLINNKHIPMIYKCNSRENRLKLLAGLLDSDGYLAHDNCTFDFIQKNETLIDDVVYLCRSLGLSCYKSKQQKGCWYNGEYKEADYYRISISGNGIHNIPTLCPRKKALPRTQVKDNLVTGINVKHIGNGNYYGFTLDGNNRYLLGDFTVTHNTISSLAVLAELKGKTIIVVNKIPLMKQWESEIKAFLPNAKVAIIQGQKIDNKAIAESDITIAMLQSLARIDYPDSLFEDYRVLLIDEIHNTASRSFSQILFKLCCKYTIGLSATPKRSDGCEYVFKWHIGEIVYKSTSERKGLDPTIKLLKIDSSDYHEINSVNRFTGQKQIQFTSMLSELIEMPKRNALIIELIKDLILQKRKILVLSDRRGHLTTLKKELDSMNVSFTYGLFVGSMKIADLEKSKASDVILATVSCFGEGVSEKDLDTLILTTPKKFIGHIKNSIKKESFKLEQIVGRIFRKEHINISPLIIDLQDNFSVYKSQAASRNVFYKGHFTTGIFENCSINLDKHDIITVSCIKTKETKTKKSTEKNMKEDAPINKFCLLD